MAREILKTMRVLLRRFGLLSLAAVVLLFGLIPAARPQSGPADAGEVQLPLLHYKLKNGLSVILSEDNSLPLVSVVVLYKTGSAYEQPGKTGLATLMENLMFSGSANVPPLQHISFINRVGGSFSAAASEDRTLFYQTIPSNRLALALWLESDRMRFLQIDETRFDQARDNLVDEVRRRRADEPYADDMSAFDQLMYPEFAFGHPLPGLEQDIRNLTVEDARAFYAAYYVPNNAVLCITGDINRVRVRELVARFFETLPRGRDATPAFEPPAPAGGAVNRSIIDGRAESPAFVLGYRLAAPPADDYYPLVVLDYILFRGRTSRLTRRLLGVNNKIAFRAAGGIERRANRAAYKLFVIAAPAMIETCREAINDELDKIKRSFLSPSELLRVKAMLRSDYYERILPMLDRALLLVDAWLTLPDIEDMPRQLTRYLAVSASDIVGIANRYFTPANSVLLNVRMK